MPRARRLGARRRRLLHQLRALTRRGGYGLGELQPQLALDRRALEARRRNLVVCLRGCAALGLSSPLELLPQRRDERLR
eukprot:5517965-Pleurochrysis_carterae.AAC.1